MKSRIAIAALAVMPLAANALDLTELSAALAEKVTAADRPARTTETGNSPWNGVR